MDFQNLILKVKHLIIGEVQKVYKVMNLMEKPIINVEMAIWPLGE